MFSHSPYSTSSLQLLTTACCSPTHHDHFKGSSSSAEAQSRKHSWQLFTGELLLSCVSLWPSSLWRPEGSTIVYSSPQPDDMSMFPQRTWLWDLLVSNNVAIALYNSYRKRNHVLVSFSKMWVTQLFHYSFATESKSRSVSFKSLNINRQEQPETGALSVSFRVKREKQVCC